MLIVSSISFTPSASNCDDGIGVGNIFTGLDSMFTSAIRRFFAGLGEASYLKVAALLLNCSGRSTVGEEEGSGLKVKRVCRFRVDLLVAILIIKSRMMLQYKSPNYTGPSQRICYTWQLSWQLSWKRGAHARRVFWLAPRYHVHSTTSILSTSSQESNSRLPYVPIPRLHRIARL